MISNFSPLARALAAFVVVAPLAAVGLEPAAPTWEQMDTNHDGRISRAEYVATRQDHLPEARAGDPPAKHWWKRTENSAAAPVVSPQSTDAAADFARLDTDGNGYLDKAELAIAGSRQLDDLDATGRNRHDDKAGARAEAAAQARKARTPNSDGTDSSK